MPGKLSPFASLRASQKSGMLSQEVGVSIVGDFIEVKGGWPFYGWKGACVNSGKKKLEDVSIPIRKGGVGAYWPSE